MKAEITFKNSRQHKLEATSLKAIKGKVESFIKGREEGIIAIRIYKEVDVSFTFNKDFMKWEL